jgi:hypothetical protein
MLIWESSSQEARFLSNEGQCVRKVKYFDDVILNSFVRLISNN